MSNFEWNTRTLSGLLWHERLRNGPFLSWVIAVWLACIWILCVFNSSGFIIAFGVLYGAAAGLRFGAMETFEGSSEFVFTLPPKRQQRYLVSLTLGLSGVLILTLLGDLALAYNLPQAFWRLFVSSGFTELYTPAESAFIHWYAVLIPIAVFAGTFAMASYAKTKILAITAPLYGMFTVGGILWLSTYLEYSYWRHYNGFVAIPGLLVFSVLALYLVYLFCLTKDQIILPKQFYGPMWWLSLVIVVVMIVFLMWGLVPLLFRPTG